MHRPRGCNAAATAPLLSARRTCVRDTVAVLMSHHRCVWLIFYIRSWFPCMFFNWHSTNQLERAQDEVGQRQLGQRPTRKLVLAHLELLASGRVTTISGNETFKSHVCRVPAAYNMLCNRHGL